jgi:hypothetical protein
MRCDALWLCFSRPSSMIPMLISVSVLFLVEAIFHVSIFCYGSFSVGVGPHPCAGFLSSLSKETPYKRRCTLIPRLSGEHIIPAIVICFYSTFFIHSY